MNEYPYQSYKQTPANEKRYIKTETKEERTKMKVHHSLPTSKHDKMIFYPQAPNKYTYLPDSAQPQQYHTYTRRITTTQQRTVICSYTYDTMKENVLTDPKLL